MRYIKLYAYLNENLGDDLMVEILLKRYPKYQFIYMGNGDGYKQLDLYDNFITRKKLKQKWAVLDRVISMLTLGKQLHYMANYLLRRIRKKAVCSVHIGGSIFIEHSSAESQVAREKEKMENSPLFIIGANFGPYIHQEFLDSFRECFKTAADICFRDQMSYQLFSELQNVHYAPDVVFNYSGAKKEKVTNEVVISVIDFHSRPALLQYADQYDQIIADICRECVSCNIKPVLMAFCKNEGDEIAIDRIYNNLSATVRKETEIMYYRDSNTIVKRMVEAKFVVATRFHAMILALLFEVPFYSIAYDRKIANVLDDIGFSGYCLPEKLHTLQAKEVLTAKQSDFPIDQIVRESNHQFAGLDHFLNQFS